MRNITPDNLHRTAKYFMDSGRAKSAEEAIRILKDFGVYVVVGAEMAESRDHQIALLSLVNLARRTFLGGVHVVGAPESPLLAPLAHASTVAGAVIELGGTNVQSIRASWPVAIIGSSGYEPQVSPCWRLTWQGWRGGVVPLKDGRKLEETASIGVTPALAAACCAAELFMYYSGDNPMAGHRDAGVSLWDPTAPWLQSDQREPVLAYLPDRLWLVGLGNLGQAYAWLLACLPYGKDPNLTLMLQDYDQLTESNDSTSVLTSGLR